MRYDHDALYAVLQRGGCVLPWRRSLTVRVDARDIELSDGRTISLLDLQRAFVDDQGFLVLETRPGPLSDIWIPAQDTPFLDLVDLAKAITEAIERASHRGDAPDERTRAVQKLLSEPR